MATSIRPLHVGKYFPPPYAGVEAHIDTLLAAFASRADSTLIACRPSGTVALASRPYRTIEAHSFGRFASVEISPSVPLLVRRELASGRCNLLHVHAPNPWGDLAALAVAAEVPVVMSWHSDIVRQRRLYRVYRPVQQRALLRADRVVVFTPAHYSGSSQLHAVDVAAKVEVIPMGIGSAHLRSPHEVPGEIERFIDRRQVILTIGRHVYYKGYAHLLEAMRSVDASAVLLMVGTGPLSESLRAQIAADGLQARVLMTGQVDDVALAALLQRADVFTLPSIEPSEAFGIASAEAMACGKPTVVCELGNGVTYLNVDGETSLVVPPRDSESLATALNRLLRDDGLRRRLGVAGQRRIETTFSVEAMADRTLQLYAELLASRRGS